MWRVKKDSKIDKNQLLKRSCIIYKIRCIIGLKRLMTLLNFKWKKKEKIAHFRPRIFLTFNNNLFQIFYFTVDPKFSGRKFCNIDEFLLF